MSDRLEPGGSTPTSALGSGEPPPAPPGRIEEARARIAALEREVRALGDGPEAALLFHEIGLLWEDPLRNPRSAASAFQAAYRLAPRFTENVRAARRIFSEVGNWQMVLQLLDAELDATEVPRARAGLLYERALVLDERLGRHEEAATAFREVIAAQTGDVGLLSQLATTWAARGDARALADTLQLLARAVEDPRVAAQCLLSAGILLEEQLHDAPGAAEAYREAFARDRSDPVLLAALARVAAREHRDDELLRVLAAEAENLGSQGGAAFLELARVYQRLGRPEDGLAALQAGRRLQPRDPLMLSALAGLLGTRGRAEELAEVLGAWATVVHDDDEAVALHLRLASLFEDTLHRDEQTIHSYRAILERSPGNAAALAGLGRLHARRRDWPGLIEVYDAELAVTAETTAKATIHYRAGEICDHRLRDTEAAVTRYEQALLLSPGYLPAQQALERLFERLERWADLAALLEQDVLQAQGPAEAVVRLGTLAGLYESRVEDPERALECLRRALDLAPDHLPSLRHAQRLAEKLGRWRDLVELLESEATHVGDAKQVVALRHRAAEALDERVGDPQAAVVVYEKLLTVAPSFLPALTALGRLYADGGRWADLASLHRTEAAVAPAERAARLLLKVGEIQERRLGDVDGALASYAQVLERTPRELQALGALARLHRSREAWAPLVAVLLQIAECRTDPRDRADVLFEAAALREHPLGDVEAATETYEEVLRLSPAHAGALRALERLASARGDSRALLAAVERSAQTALAPETRVAAYLKLSRLYLDRLDEPARAAQMAEEALAIEPRNLHALLVLERVRAADRARRAEVKTRLADRVTDDSFASALRLMASLDREEADVPDRARELGAAFAVDPSDVRVAFALEGTLRQAGEPAALWAFYARRLETARDDTERLSLQMRLAEAAEAGATDLPTAREAYRAALVLHPGFLPALQGIRRVAERLGDWPTAIAAREAEAEAIHDVRGAVEAWTAAARHARDRLGDRERALRSYRRALARDPLHEQAAAEVEVLLTGTGDPTELAALHERQAEARLTAGDRSGAASAFHRAAETWRRTVRDPVRALATLERVLDADPGHGGALLAKAELALEQGRWADAAESFTARVRLGGEPEVLSALHLKLGALFQEQLGDPNRAVAHFQAALAGHPGLPEALERLVTLYIASENWTGASDSLKRLLELDAEPAGRGRHTLELARVMDAGFGDALRAAELYRRALELGSGDDPTTLERVGELHERGGELAGLLQTLEAAAAASPPPRAARLLRKLGELCARVLGDETRAILCFRQATELQPASVEARAALAVLLEKDPGSLEQAVDAHRAVVRVDPTHTESLHALFRIWEQARQLDRAFCVAAVLVFLRAANDRETYLHLDWRSRLPQDCDDRLGPDELALLHGAEASGPLVDLLRVVGDEIGEEVPPSFESLGVDRRSDRLRPDHPVHRAIRLSAETFGVHSLEAYQARRGLVVVEPTRPQALCVGQEVVRRFNAREQKFLIGRAVLGLLNKTAVVSRLSTADAATHLGVAVRAMVPGFSGLGTPTDAMAQALRKRLARRTLRALGPAARAVALSEVDLVATLGALSAAANRAGMLMAADPAVALGLVLREDPNVAGMRSEASEPVLQAVRERSDLRALIAFAVSDAFFRLRQTVGLALPEKTP